MHDLEVIKNACVGAINDGDGKLGGLALYHDVVDPATVLELVDVVEAGITPHELETLTRLINRLTDYVETVPDVEGKAAHIDREELIRYAKHIYGLFAR
jgi:hypothetical protein